MAGNQLVLIVVLVIIILLVWWIWHQNELNKTPKVVTTTTCVTNSDCIPGSFCNLDTGLCEKLIEGACIGPCPEGPVGPPGPPGQAGEPGGQLGSAQYVRQIQSPNNSVPPGTAFTVDTEVYNTMPSDVVASAGAGGTVWTLNTPGTYVFNYEMSLGSSGSIALYKGPSSGSLAIDNATIAGSSTATSWVHGRAGIVVTTAPLVVAVSSVVGTANVVVSGNAAGFYTVRVGITRVA